MLLAATKDICRLSDRQSKARYASQVYEVKVKTLGAKQGNKTIREYANQLKALCQELDHHRVIKIKCYEDAAVIKEYIEQDKSIFW